MKSRPLLPSCAARVIRISSLGPVRICRGCNRKINNRVLSAVCQFPRQLRNIFETNLRGRKRLLLLLLNSGEKQCGLSVYVIRISVRHLRGRLLFIWTPPRTRNVCFWF